MADAVRLYLSRDDNLRASAAAALFRVPRIFVMGVRRLDFERINEIAGMIIRRRPVPSRFVPL
jgi:hypothetical protein